MIPGLAMNKEETQQQPPDRMLELLAWIETNKQRLLYGAIAVLVVGLGTYIYNYLHEQREHEASAALFDLDKLPEGRGKQTYPAATEYLRVADSFSGTQTGERALLMAGEALFREQKFDEARAKYEQFLRDNSSSVGAGVAAFGVAACLDAKNDLDKALEAYARVVSTYPGSPEATQARLAQAVLYETKQQPEPALKIYDELGRVRPPTVWAQEAGMRREMLLAKYPKLAPPPVVALPPVLSTNLSTTVLTNSAVKKK